MYTWAKFIFQLSIMGLLNTIENEIYSGLNIHDCKKISLTWT